jgi:small-conductance mechanosensitive channel
MKKFIEFINKEFFITENIKFSIVTIILVSLIFLITYFSLKIIKKIATKKLDEERKLKFKSVFSFLNYFVYIIVALITFQNFGINLTGIFAASAALLVGIGLALQTFFQDIISGILILADQTVHVGDIIEIDGKVGRVENIKIRTTRAVTFDNKVLIIPNHKYLTSTLFNWTENGTVLRGSVSVGVSYDSDVQKIKEILLQIANDHPNLIKNPSPKVLFNNFGDSALEFELVFTYNNGFRVNLIESDIRFLVHKSFKENNIEIPFPQRVVHLQK